MSTPRPRLYIAFDDTDNLGAPRGTGKVGRWFADELPDGLEFVGVVRQQLLVHPDVPYTSHNSSAVVVADALDVGDGAGDPRRLRTLVDEVVARAVAHVEKLALPGSDPGVCVAAAPGGNGHLGALVAFGRRAVFEVVSQREAHDAARGSSAHLSGHGGTNDGVIGAAAGVGLTAYGWNGRFIELACGGHLLRDFADLVPAGELRAAGIELAALDRDAPVPLPEALVQTDGWLRPRLWGGRALLPVQRARADGDLWVAVGPRTLPHPEDDAEIASAKEEA